MDEKGLVADVLRTLDFVTDERIAAEKVVADCKTDSVYGMATDHRVIILRAIENRLVRALARAERKVA